jgi:hypothetical protein
VNRRQSMACLILFLAGGSLALPAAAHYRSDAVSVEVIDASGQPFEVFPLKASRSDHQRAYLKAERGARYRIRVRNLTGERIGVVLAVDGRNIVSGQRSELKSGESMYVLDAYESSDYAGWRTNLREVHEFYFTDWRDAYAEAFGDRSARGVIALAVFRDRDWQARLRAEQELSSQLARDAEKSRGSAESADSAGRPAPAASARAAAPPGTGFGERRDDPARRVQFNADSTPIMKSFLKYEWAETLRARGFGCSPREPLYGNRFWPDDSAGFAPYPR